MRWPCGLPVREKKKLSVNGPILFQKAKDMAREMGIPPPCESWVDKFKQRQNIVFKRMHGESNDADTAAAEEFIAKTTALRNEYPLNESEFFSRTPKWNTLLQNGNCKVFKRTEGPANSRGMLSMQVTLLQELSIQGSKKNALCTPLTLATRRQ